MKTKRLLFLLPLLAISTLSATGCNKKKQSTLSRITYGTYASTSAELLDYSSLAKKMAEKEVLLIAIYDDSGLPCGCWKTFQKVLDEYVKQYHTKVYYMKRSSFSEGADTFGLTILKEGTNPTFAVMQDGKKTAEYIYSNDLKPMFETVDGLRSTITRIVRDPQFMWVDDEYLDDALFTHPKERVVIFYAWSFCPDCNDCLPNVMFPYSEENDFKTEVWLIDLAISGILLDGEGKFIGTNNPTYVEYLKEHHMSAAGDEVFGYDRGFVPTTQLWENGELKDATVYFNDTIENVDGALKVTKTYYTSERVPYLNYTNTVLEGLEVTENDVEANTDGTYSWKQDSARVYHQPILESFLDTYIKK